MGVEASARLAEVVGAQAVLGGCCRIMSARVAPGHIQHRGSLDPALLVGEVDNRRSARVEALCQALCQAGVRTVIPADMQGAVWHKFLQVAAFGGVGAVTRAPIGTLCRLPETRALMIQVMQEIVAVAQAQHIALPADVIPRTLAELAQFPPGGTNSMQRDLMSGRPSELGGACRGGRPPRAGAGCPHTREHVSLPQSVALGTPGAGPPRVPEVTTGLAPCPQLVAPAPLPARFAKHGGHPLPRSTTPSGHAGCRRRGEVSRKPGLRVCGPRHQGFRLSESLSAKGRHGTDRRTTDPQALPGYHSGLVDERIAQHGCSCTENAGAHV